MAATRSARSQEEQSREPDFADTRELTSARCVHQRRWPAVNSKKQLFLNCFLRGERGSPGLPGASDSESASESDWAGHALLDPKQSFVLETASGISPCATKQQEADALQCHGNSLSLTPGLHSSLSFHRHGFFQLIL